MLTDSDLLCAHSCLLTTWCDTVPEWTSYLMRVILNLKRFTAYKM